MMPKIYPEAATGGVLLKKVFLKKSQNSQGNTWIEHLSYYSSEACSFIKKETPTQVFSSEICEIFKNTFFTEHSGRLLLYISKSD